MQLLLTSLITPYHVPTSAHPTCTNNNTMNNPWVPYPSRFDHEAAKLQCTILDRQPEFDQMLKWLEDWATTLQPNLSPTVPHNSNIIPN